MATRKMKRYEEGGNVTEDELEIANRSEDPIASLNAQKKWTSTEESPKATPAKPRVVTKEELAKSGLSLRDYMNKQQGLTRKGDSASSEVSSKPRDTGDESDRLANRFKKPGLRQETMKERAESYNAKRWAQQAEDAAKDKTPRGQDRILTGLKKKSDENKFMGSTGLKKGGPVRSSASKRADGIAIRGKTRA